MLEFTDANFASEVLGAARPVLVDFTAMWCGPCHQLKPIIEEIAAELNGRLKVGVLDIDVNINTAMDYQVMGLPTLILFKEGQPVERVQGFMPKPRLWRKLSPHLN